MIKFTKKNFDNIQILVLFLLLLIVIISVVLINCKINKNEKIVISNKLVRDKYYNLVEILGKPTYVEVDSEKNMKSATWMSPLDNFHDFGKYGGCDYLKILGEPSKKYHPHPANVFLIVGKYLKVPEHLFGPLKYASETINIEQLLIPTYYSMKYYNTGEKELALVTGSCASITISVITIQFVMDMIQKYKDDIKSLELYQEFRNEYDRRIDDYLCGRGITDKIDWFDPKYYQEADKAYLGDDKCKNLENFTHYEECEDLMKQDNFCKKEPDHKCC